MPIETFDTPRYQYTCVAASGAEDACVLRYRRAISGKRVGQWVRDREWIVPRYMTYEAAREAALRFATEDGERDVGNIEEGR